MLSADETGMLKCHSSLLLGDVHAVDNSLLGFATLHDGLIVLPHCRAVLRKDYVNRSDNKVKLISGAAAGNEPSHIGFVGPGMLSAAVSGNIFSAPSSKAIFNTIEELCSNCSAGVLLIVQNRAGYNINFALAQMRAQNKGFNVEMISVADDVVETLQHNIPTRQGLSGIIFIHKIAGAMAEEGQCLNDIRNECEKIVMDRQVVSVSIRLKPLSSGKMVGPETVPIYQLEIGCGTHGEPGMQTSKYTSLKDIAETVIQTMVNVSWEKSCPKIESSKRFNSGDNVAVLVNNFGEGSQIRSNIVLLEIVSQLKALGLKVQRIYAGSLMTLPDYTGFYISLLRLSTARLLNYLDAPTSAPAWPRTLSSIQVLSADEHNENRATLWDEKSYQGTQRPSSDIFETRFVQTQGPEMNKRGREVLYTTVLFACEALIACTDQLNTMDSETGDGDCGATLARGSNAVVSAIKENKFLSKRPLVILTQIGEIIESCMGGLQGGMYSIFVEAAATSFAKCDSRESVTARMWVDALMAGIEALSQFWKVPVSERTMLNPLMAAHRELSYALNSGEGVLSAFGTAVKAAEKSATETAYVRKLTHYPTTDKYQTFMHPDAGAHAVGIWMRAAYEAVKLKLSCYP